MKFSVTSNLNFYSDFCIVTGIFEECCLFPATTHVNKISQGYISDLLKRNAFNGLIGTKLFLYDAPYFLNKQILLIGCGKKDLFDSDNYNKIVHKIIKFCKEEYISKVLFLLSELDILGYDNYWKIRHTISIFQKEMYTFYKFKTNSITSSYLLNDIILYIKNPNELKICEKAVSEGLIISNGTNLAKDLSNMPPNYCTPIYLSKEVQKLPNIYKKVHVKILDEPAIKKLGMYAYLSVGKGSSYPAVLPIIKYLNHPNGSKVSPIVLIGKGLTFDSGGISIKPSDHMDEMKYDMCGAAVVYAIMRIAAELQLPLNIIGILAISENMISNNSLRPGDILTTLSGQTVEVLNTDAEGRLVLCDVLTYVKKYSPELVIDIATLTGACVVALGNCFNGLISNNNDLATDILNAAKQTRDYTWRLPLSKTLEKQLYSNCADVANVGGKYGGAITAACFLKKFIGQYPWAHLDIAGTAWISKDRDKSSTGRPVELLSQFLINKVLCNMI